MSIFIDITVNGDLSLLIIKGSPDVSKAWGQIHSEFVEISGNTSASQGLKVAIDVHYYTNRLNNIYHIVNYLRTRYVPELCEELRNMGFNYKFTDLHADLNRVLIRAKTDETKLKVAVEAYTKLQGDDTKATKLQWAQRLSQLAKYQGVASINPSLISVLNFVALEKEFINSLKK